MDGCKENTSTIIHLDLATYLNEVEQGNFPKRVLKARLLDDFELNGQKFCINMDLHDHHLNFPDDDFEKIISSNPRYIKKLMHVFEAASTRFLSLLHKTLAKDSVLFNKHKTPLLLSYLHKLIQLSPLPESIKQNANKVIFYRDFCQQVAQAYVAHRRPEDFKQFAATRSVNLYRMRRIVNYLSLSLLSKRKLYRHFIVLENYINAHTLTLMPESDLKLRLLVKLLETYNGTVAILHRYAQVQSNDSGRSHKHILSEHFEPLMLSANLTIEEILKHMVHMLKFIATDINKDKFNEVLAAFRGHSFFEQDKTYLTVPDELAGKIQEHLEKVYLLDNIKPNF